MGAIPRLGFGWVSTPKTPLDYEWTICNVGDKNGDVGFLMFEDNGVLAKSPFQGDTSHLSAINGQGSNRAAGSCTQPQINALPRKLKTPKVSVAEVVKINNKWIAYNWHTFDVPALAVEQAQEDASPPPAPSPSPTPGPELFTFTVFTPVSHVLPNWVVDRLRNVLAVGGWKLNNIFPVDGGYQLDMEKEGSFAILGVIKAIAWILKLAGVTILGWKVLDLGQNVVEQKTASIELEADKLGLVEQVMSDPTLTVAQKEAFLNSIAKVSPSADDSNGGFFGGFDITEGALVAAVLLLAFKK